jgi:arylformamidase
MLMRPRLDDAAWLEAQYNNRARVADAIDQLAGWADAIDQLAGWADASRHARDGSPGKRLDIAYGDGPRETLDIFPAAAANAPVLIFVHGGYWRSLSKDDFSFVAPSFVADGAMVVVPDYALCPAVTVEDIALQMVKAVAWTWGHAAEHGGNPHRIAVVGHSAGGHLAAMLLSCRWKQVGDDLPLQPLAGALAISGLYDLEPLRHAAFLQTDLRLTPQQVARCSPAFFPRPKVGADSGKLYATVGADESDEFLRHNQLIRDQWGPTAVPVCETVPGKNHFTVLESLADPKGRLHDLALRLLDLR